MGRVTFSLLVAALLVSLLAHRLPVCCARHVAVLRVNKGFNSRGDMNLAKESADDLGAKKGFEGRKLGAGTMEEDEALEVKGDQKEKADAASRLNPKPQGSQTEQQGLAGTAADRRRLPANSAAAAGTRPRMVELRAAAGKHPDPVTEVYEMLRSDYRSRASRRRPINNGVPLQHQEP